MPVVVSLGGTVFCISTACGVLFFCGPSGRVNFTLTTAKNAHIRPIVSRNGLSVFLAICQFPLMQPRLV